VAKKISQAEARRLKRRVAQLEDEKRTAFYGSSAELVNFDPLGDWAKGTLNAAQKLGHKLVARVEGSKLTVSALR
jgi:hypothetical protein